MVSACVYSAKNNYIVCEKTWMNVHPTSNLGGVLIFLFTLKVKSWIISEVFHMLEMGKQKIEGD